VNASLNSQSLGGDLAWIRRGVLHNAPLTPAHSRVPPSPSAQRNLVVARRILRRPVGTKLALYTFDAALAKVRHTHFETKLSAVEAVPVEVHDRRAVLEHADPELQRDILFVRGLWPRAFPKEGLRRISHGSSADARCRHPTGKSLFGGSAHGEDGSFTSPCARQAVRFEVLDGTGHVGPGASEAGSGLVRRGEGCVGCTKTAWLGKSLAAGACAALTRPRGWVWLSSVSAH